MDYVLPIGTKIVFRDTPHNRKVMGYRADGPNDFTFGKEYEVEFDEDFSCYFVDDVVHANYAGFAINGEDGIFEIV